MPPPTHRAEYRPDDDYLGLRTLLPRVQQSRYARLPAGRAQTMRTTATASTVAVPE